MYHFEADKSTPIDTILSELAQRMESSPSHFVFKSTRVGHLNHEVPPLRILEYVDRGRVRLLKNEIRFRIKPPTPGLTIWKLMNDRNRYSHPEYSFDGNRYILHLSSYLLSLSWLATDINLGILQSSVSTRLNQQ